MGDYISREAAVTEVCDRGKFYNKIHDRFGGTSDICASAHFEISELIMRLPAADVEPVRRWNPCSERLPGEGGSYLVANDTTGWIGVYNFALAKDFPCCTGLENVWWRLTDKCDPLPMDGVTHWMPLPEPPKEADKDGR